MADTIVNVTAPVMTISVPSGTSGLLVGLPHHTLDIYNVGESGQSVYFNMVGGTIQTTGTTGAANQFWLVAS